MKIPKQLQWFINGQSFFFHVYAPASEVRQRLSTISDTESKTMIGRRKYSASLNGSDFRFWRESGISPTFPPEISGVINQGEGYTEAKGIAQLNAKTVRSLAQVALFAFVSMTLLAVQNRGGEPMDWFVGIGAGLGAVAFILAGMKLFTVTASSDWKRDLQALESILEGEVGNGTNART
jgi:hypothetical protein